MIPKAITAPFRWWGKHPWIVFWVTLSLPIPLLYLCLEGLPPLLGETVSVFGILLWEMVIILSFGRGTFLISQRSKIRANQITVGALLIVIGSCAALIKYGLVDPYRRRGYKAEILITLRGTANAQGSYFAKNNSYKSCAPCTSTNLPGYDNRFPKVTLVAEVGKTEFVLVATDKRCGDSQWIYQRSTGRITGPNAQDVCK